jgi:hypothetical protein
VDAGGVHHCPSLLRPRDVTRLQDALVCGCVAEHVLAVFAGSGGRITLLVMAVTCAAMRASLARRTSSLLQVKITKCEIFLDLPALAAYIPIVPSAEGRFMRRH